jgi:hypothetical protein
MNKKNVSRNAAVAGNQPSATREKNHRLMQTVIIGGLGPADSLIHDISEAIEGIMLCFEVDFLKLDGKPERCQSRALRMCKKHK